MKDWLRQLFAVIDRKDVEGFVLFLAEDASFRFANFVAVVGRDNIRKAVSSFFSQIKGLQHRIIEVWEYADTVICEGEVTYMRNDDTKLTLPFANIFRMKDNLIADYRIYIDISPLSDKL